MGYLSAAGDTLSPWIREEIELEGTLQKGKRGKAVRRIQEWLNLHEMGLDIDGDFGRITERKIKQFQEAHGITPSGIVEAETFQELVAPLRRVLQPITPADTGDSLSNLVAAYALAHLQEHPRETGGQNRGPWVRLYMKGNEGPQWAWCAGFVSFLMAQAAETLQSSLPIPGSFSCDTLAAQGQSAGRFIKESALADGTTSVSDLPAASLFLVRRTNTDWTHTGIVTHFHEDCFDTIEGNTNDDGSREGYEVCARTRGYGGKDFIML